MIWLLGSERLSAGSNANLLYMAVTAEPSGREHYWSERWVLHFVDMLLINSSLLIPCLFYTDDRKYVGLLGV